MTPWKLRACLLQTCSYARGPLYSNIANRLHPKVTFSLLLSSSGLIRQSFCGEKNSGFFTQIKVVYSYLRSYKRQNSGWIKKGWRLQANLSDDRSDERTIKNDAFCLWNCVSIQSGFFGRSNDRPKICANHCDSWCRRLQNATWAVSYGWPADNSLHV